MEFGACIGQQHRCLISLFAPWSKPIRDCTTLLCHRKSPHPGRPSVDQLWIKWNNTLYEIQYLYCITYKQNNIAWGLIILMQSIDRKKENNLTCNSTACDYVFVLQVNSPMCSYEISTQWLYTQHLQVLYVVWHLPCTQTYASDWLSKISDTRVHYMIS
jgi:hypothetical protein